MGATDQELFTYLRIIEEQIKKGFYDSEYKKELGETLEMFATGRVTPPDPEIMKTIFCLTMQFESFNKLNNKG